MRRCGNGLSSAKPGSHSAEKRAEVVLSHPATASSEQVLRPVVSHECLRDCLARALHANVTEVRQAQGITVACEDRIQDGQPTGTRDVAQHMMDLQVHQAEKLLYVLGVFGGHLAQAAAVSPESAHRTDVFRWAEAGLQQSYRVRILNPLTVGHITLAAGDGLQRMRVDQIPVA